MPCAMARSRYSRIMSGVHCWYPAKKAGFAVSVSMMVLSRYDVVVVKVRDFQSKSQGNKECVRDCQGTRLSRYGIFKVRDFQGTRFSEKW